MSILVEYYGIQNVSTQAECYNYLLQEANAKMKCKDIIYLLYLFIYYTKIPIIIFATSPPTSLSESLSLLMLHLKAVTFES